MKPPASLLTIILLLTLLAACSSKQIRPATAPVILPTATTVPKINFRVVAYATDAVIESIIPYDKLTHINYSFLIPNADGTLAPFVNSWKLKAIVKSAHEQDVKVSIAVGGWGWDETFEQLAAAPETRGAFVQNIKSFVEEYQLDGVDMDWEYPDAGESSQNFLALMVELRAALPDTLLSTAVVSDGDYYGLGIPVESFTLVDFVNVMAYDGEGHGSMEQFNNGISYWAKRGAPKEKINIGVPFYSRPGEITYSKLIQADSAAAQIDVFDYYGAEQTYNGIPTMQTKTKLAMQNAGGIMFWALDHDAQGDLSLVNAIFETIKTNSQ